MRKLSKSEIGEISRELQSQGITFSPLYEELLDHLICDVEIHMEQGEDFDTAWQLVKEGIPENHFKHVQTETMEVLNKKINPVRTFGIISLALLAFATLFKMFHLQGAGHLLLAFLTSVSITLLVGYTRSVYIYREAKGRGVFFLTTLLIISFIVALGFRILHLPGAGPLLYFSVIGICVIFPALSLYFYRSSHKLKGYLLIKLIKDNQGILEKTAMILIGFGLVFNYSALLFQQPNFGGVVFFVFSLILTGIYVYSLSWRYYVENNDSQQRFSMLLLVSSSVAFIMFMLPVMGNDLNFLARNIFAYLPMLIFISIVLVYYNKFSQSVHKSELVVLSSLMLLYPLLRFGTKLGWYGEFPGGLTTNTTFTVGFLIFLIVLLIRYRKEQLFKALIILTIASHMIPSM